MTLTNKDYKILAIDLDGTTLDNGVLSPVVEETLARLVEEGTDVAIATGRSLPTVPMCIRSLPFIRYAVVSNGARVYDYKEKKTISEALIDMEVALEIIETINTPSNIIVMYDDVLILPVRTYIRYLRSFEFWKRLYSRNTSRKIVKEALKSTKIVFSLINTIKQRGEPVEKINLRYATRRKRKKVSRLLEQFPVEAVTTMGYDLEVSAKGITKASGIKELCEHLSISPEQVIAAGDSTNDLEMLKYAGFAIVMDNANDDIKEVADKVAPDVKEDGLATALIDLFGL